MAALNHSNNTELLTLTRHVLNEQRRHHDASGDLTLLLVSIQLGCKFVASSVRKAGLVNLYAPFKGVSLKNAGLDWRLGEMLMCRVSRSRSWMSCPMTYSSTVYAQVGK